MQYDIVDGGYLTWLYGAKPFARAAWPPQSVRGAYLALDCLDKSFRTQRDATYKANRIDKRFEDHHLYEQWQRIRELRRDVIEDPRLNCIRIPGLEADDIIALLAWKFGNKGILQLLAQDKDLLQVSSVQITDNQGVSVDLARFSKRLPKAITREPLKRNQIPLILSLMGDKSDNIPRLIERSDLYILAQALNRKRKEAYRVALKQYGNRFLKNLYAVILPDPHLFNFSLKDVYELCAEGSWDATLLGSLTSDYAFEVASWKEKVMVSRRTK